MDKFALVSGCVAGLWACMPAIAGEVELRLSGAAFEGGPMFEATMGGEVIGSGVLDNPSAEATVFLLIVDEDLLAGGGDLTIRLTNDYFVGEGKDRSLIVLSARVGAVEFAPEDFILTSAGEPIERDRTNGVRIWSGDDIAVANAPELGWLGESNTVSPNEQVPHGVADCSRFAEVTGFPLNDTSIQATELDDLQAIVEAAATGYCSVTITGYADETGSDLANRRITAARAAAVQLWASQSQATGAAEPVDEASDNPENGPT